jgi:FecR-like protein
MSAPHLTNERLAEVGAGAPPDDEEAEHLLDCRACSLAIEGDDAVGRALETARRVEPDVWSEPRLRAGQTRLVAALGRRRAARYVVPVFAGALAAAAAWSFWPRSSLPGPGDALAIAEVEAQPDATVEVAQAGPDQVVEVAQGQAAFKVRRLRQAERFRVRCGRDEVEVRGTRFVVHGGGEGFSSVEVTEGAVELRTACCGTRLLRAGETWTRSKAALAPEGPTVPSAPVTSTTPAPPPPEAPSAANTAAREPGPKPTTGRPLPPPHEPEPTADALRQRALEAYDRGDYEIAARGFDAAAQKAPDAAWVGDARTLAGAARVLRAPVGSIGSLSVGVAALDAAAQRAARAGDSARAAAARVAAARRSSGEGARKRWCALRRDPLVSADVRSEAARLCPDAP